MLPDLAKSFWPFAMAASQVPLMRVPPSSSSNHDVRERLNDVIPSIRDIQEIGGTAGMSIGVIQNGEIVLEHP